jgi:peptidoglycan/xylan/chitin deacetylase (PgdA/CDA1 family)
MIICLMFFILGCSMCFANDWPLGIKKVATTEKLIAFTFDAHAIGDEPLNGLPEILNTLAVNHIHCTFFLTGMFIEKHPEIVREIVAQGHEVGNHTYSHTFVNPDQESRERLTEELNRTRTLFKETTGTDMAGFWRAPYGNVNPAMLEWAKEAGFQHIGWEVDTWDWITDKNYIHYLTAEGLYQRVHTFLENGASGYIFLSHLSTGRTTDNYASVLQKVIDDAHRQGYRLVTVSELLKNGPNQ